MKQLVDLLLVGRMAEDRQPERRLGDEDVAIAGLEGCSGRVGPTLIIAGGHNPGAAVVERDLRPAHHVSSRQQSQRDAADRDGFSIIERLQ